MSLISEFIDDHEKRLREIELSISRIKAEAGQYFFNPMTNKHTFYRFNDPSFTEGSMNEGRINEISGLIVKDLLLDFTDRRGFKQEWAEVGVDIREEIRDTWFKIVRNRLKLLVSI